MGDYPLLINGSRPQASRRARRPRWSRSPATTRKGALNGVVVAAGLAGRPTSSDLAGQEGLRQRRLGRPRHPGAGARRGRDRPGHGRRGARTSSRRSAPPRCESGQRRRAVAVRRLAGPAGLPDKAALLYDGARAEPADLPRRRGPQDVRRASTRTCVDAFLAGAARRHRLSCTSTRSRRPRSSPSRPGCRPRWSTSTTAATACTTFDPTIKPQQVDALNHDVPFLKSIGVLADPLDVDALRRRPRCVRKASTARPTTPRSPSRRTPPRSPARDPVCGRPVRDPAHGRRGLGRRRGRAPSPSPTRPACCARSPQAQAEGEHGPGGVRPRRADRHPLVRRPDRSGCATARSFLPVRHRRQRPSATAHDHPRRRRSTYDRRVEAGPR